MGIGTGLKRAVFLDRDGVINRAVVRAGKPCPPATVSELEILPGVQQALERLRHCGFLLVVVTNQPDVARGRQSRAVVEQMHDVLMSHLPLDEIRVCFHDDDDRCDCRKPAPGLLVAAATDRHIDLHSSFMVGDRWRDILAGKRAGCATVMIDYDYAEAVHVEPDFHAASLIDAAHTIIGTHGNAATIKSVL